MNLIKVISLCLEPIMPAFSAKVYYLLNIERSKEEERALSKISKGNEIGLAQILKPGSSIR